MLTCLIFPALAQLYGVAEPSAAQMTEAFTATYRPDAASLREPLLTSPLLCNANTHVHMSGPHHYRSPYTCIPCHYSPGPCTLSPRCPPVPQRCYLGRDGGLGQAWEGWGPR